MVPDIEVENGAEEEDLEDEDDDVDDVVEEEEGDGVEEEEEAEDDDEKWITVLPFVQLNNFVTKHYYRNGLCMSNVYRENRGHSMTDTKYRILFRF